jgi:hypothetical protein
MNPTCLLKQCLTPDHRIICMRSFGLVKSMAKLERSSPYETVHSEKMDNSVDSIWNYFCEFV